MKKLTYQLWLIGAVIFGSMATTVPTQAQIAGDGTLPNPTQVQTPDSRNFTITGGSHRGANLFHSFGEFSVPQGGSARFNNNATVGNIIGRVTGDSISNIEGAIAANGSANLFLINPNGIIFGSNASLQIGGSFIASTADSLVFQDGTQFSATNPQTSPLLTISVPVGLQFGQNPGAIRNYSQFSRFFPESGQEKVAGLEVKPSKTLALVGEQVFQEGGRLYAPAGRIELGSIAGASLVSLSPNAKGFALGYEKTNNFQDIRLSQAASLDATGKSSSGEIFYKANRFLLLTVHQYQVRI